MFGKFLGWMAKPITWGALLKLYGFCTIISMAAGFVWIFWEKIASFGNRFLAKLEGLRK